MINIPTELLRTLVAVVELRSFTQAARSLGITQPAVSAQIKRLQILLDSELLDKSAPGVSLTPTGHLVVKFARQMLSINDQIIEIALPKLSNQLVRIGVSSDFAGPSLPPLLSEFKLRYPTLRFLVRGGDFDTMLRELRHGALDLLIGLSDSDAGIDALYQWTEPMVWVRDPGLQMDPALPVPLVTFGEISAYHRIAVKALAEADRDYDQVFAGASEACIWAAVGSELGVTAIPQRIAVQAGVTPWHNAPLPPLDDAICNICLGQNREGVVLKELAEAVRDLLGAHSIVPDAPPVPTESV